MTTEITTPETFVPTVSKQRLPSIAAPTNWADLMPFCEALSKSDLVPKDFRDKPANLAIAISMGNEVGLHWTHAIQSIAVINGRPSLWGDGALAVVMAHPDFEWIDENESTDTAGVTKIKRRGMPELRYEYTLEMARTAGYLSKDTYKGNLKAMLQRRSRARCMSATFADALKGIAFAEDVLQAQPEKDIGGGPAEPQPKAKQVQERLAKRKEAQADVQPEQKPAVIDGATGEIIDADTIIAKIKDAKTAAELTLAADLARSIKDEAKQATAQEAYHASLTRIRKGG